MYFPFLQSILKTFNMSITFTIREWLPLNESPLCKNIVILCFLHVPKYKASIFKVKSTSFLNKDSVTQTTWYQSHSQ